MSAIGAARPATQTFVLAGEGGNRKLARAYTRKCFTVENPPSVSILTW